MTGLATRLARRARLSLAHAFLPDPRPGAGGQFSMIYPDNSGTPNARLLQLVRDCIPLAAGADMSGISGRIQEGPRWPDVWPGEHYKLLAGLVTALGARRVVEIGTYQGLSALALLQALPADGTVHTFDVVRCFDVPGNVLRESDFADGRLRQVLDDVTREPGLSRNARILSDADLIFVDAAKDGRMEQRLLELMAKLRFTSSPIMVFDDIRMWEMLRIWSEISRPRFDATSVGHFSGTGLVDWCG